MTAITLPSRSRKKDRSPVGLGGLWEQWTDSSSGETVGTCAIITTTANASRAPIHDRMPVIIGLDDVARWIGEEPADDETPAALMRPYAAIDLEAFAVDNRVGNLRNDDRSWFVPAAPPTLA